jgi:hypothetical protein
MENCTGDGRDIAEGASEPRFVLRKLVLFHKCSDLAGRMISILSHFVMLTSVEADGAPLDGNLFEPVYQPKDPGRQFAQRLSTGIQ